MRKISLANKDKSLSTKTKVILITLASIIAICGLGVWLFLENYHIYETIVVNPTCEAKGYTESKCIYCEEINRTHYVAPLGHDFDEPKLTEKATDISFGQKTQTCSRCKVQKKHSIEPTINMKKFYFTGDAFGVDSKKIAEGVLTYSFGGKKTDYYILLKYADKSNIRYIKHDYNIEFFADKKHTKEIKVSLMNGVDAAHEWGLYGNFYDFYNLRDTVTTELFCEVRKTSKKIDSRLGDNFITSKSEPVLFYMNESLVGAFRLVQPTVAQTMNVKEDTKMTAIVRASSAASASYFKSQALEGGTWKILHNYTDDDEWVYASLNELIDFVSSAEGDDFKKGISNYLDVDGMIDYMLTVYNTAAADNVARSLTLATYDGKVWTPSIYDANASLGMNNDGEITTLETVLAPSMTDGEIYSDTNSVLFQKMLECFYDEIKLRYTVLKGTVFTVDNIYSKFENRIDDVPSSVYEHEKNKYSIVDSQTDLKGSIAEFIAVRRNVLDVFFSNKKATAQ